MTVRLDGQVVRLEGACHLEEAEVLVSLLQGAAGRTVDLSRARTLHGAVVQALLALQPPIQAPPPDALLRNLLAPGLTTFI